MPQELEADRVRKQEESVGSRALTAHTFVSATNRTIKTAPSIGARLVSGIFSSSTARLPGRRLLLPAHSS